jgi:hypothetical protein
MVKRASFLQSLKTVDIFGREITLTYAGERKFKTEIGGVFSIVSLLIVFAFGLSSIFKVAKNEMTSFASQLKFLYPDEHNKLGFDLGNVGFQAAYGVIGAPIDPTYGRISITHVKKTIDIDLIQKFGVGNLTRNTTNTGSV